MLNLGKLFHDSIELGVAESLFESRVRRGIDAGESEREQGRR